MWIKILIQICLFTGHPNFLQLRTGASAYTTDYHNFINENLDWEELLEDDDSYHKSVSESSIPDEYVNNWLAILNDDNFGVSYEEAVRRSLAGWVLDCNIPRAQHVLHLLKRLNRDSGLTYLPLGSRTLLKSLRSRIQCCWAWLLIQFWHIFDSCCCFGSFKLNGHFKCFAIYICNFDVLVSCRCRQFLMLGQLQWWNVKCWEFTCNRLKIYILWQLVC